MNKLIYTDRAKWSKRVTCLAPAIVSEYKLGGFQLAILDYIISEYNRQIYTLEKNVGVALSYEDVCRKLNVERDTAKYSMQSLLQKELIIKTGDRKGRAKTTYKPNIELLNKLLDEYLKYNIEDEK